MVIFNLKTYPEASGSGIQDEIDAVSKLIKETPQAKDVIYMAPQVLDILTVKRANADIHLLSQHVDPKESGKTTGMVTAERLKDIGVGMSLLNHSEHRLEAGTLTVSITYLQKQGLKLVVCMENMEEAEEVLPFKPFAVAYEPKELIGSGKSVSTEKIDVVKDFVRLVNEKSESKAIIGAGVSTGEDVKACRELGADGVLIASAFAKEPAESKYEKLVELVTPYLS